MSRLLTLVLLGSVAACGATRRPIAAPGEPFDPVGSYRTGGDCLHGSPESPTCIQSLRLVAGGTGSFVGDDILEEVTEDVTWKLEGDHVVVELRTWRFILRFGAGHTLLGEHGEVWSLEGG